MLECQCNCGAVRFGIMAKVSDIYVCHCSICRRFTGAGNVSVVVLANDNFKWLSGHDTVKVWKKPDVDWEANFCSVCGSAVPGRNDPAHMFVPAGLLPDGTQPLSVKHHIFVGSKAAWDVIGDDGKQHLGAIGS